MAVIAGSFLPFDAGAGSAVAESGWRSMAQHWIPPGPLVSGAGILDALKPTAGAGLQVLVALGEAWVKGHWASWTGQSALTVASNSSGSTRVDAIVIRADFVNNRLELDLVAGTPGAGIPALTQSSSVWEILIGSSTLVSGGSSVTVADLRKLSGWYANGKPWQSAWGLVASGSTDQDVTSAGSFSDFVSTTVDIIAGRRYRYTLMTGVYSSVANDIVRLRVSSGANVDVGVPDIYDFDCQTLLTPITFTCTETATTTALATTRKVRLLRVQGTGAVGLRADPASRIAVLTVDDIGPA